MIYINHDKKYIFVRTAKTGSTSLLHSLRSIGGQKKIRHQCLYDKNHIPADYIKNNYTKYFKNYFTFGFVRNPWSRMVSVWRMNMRFHRNTPDFKDYVKSIPAFEWMPKKPKRKWKKTPREVWLYKYSSMYEFTNGCDFVGKLENLQQDFNIVCEKIGVPHRQLPHTNKTKHKHYTEYYDNETREIVAEKYAKDIEYFGYKFRD